MTYDTIKSINGITEKNIFNPCGFLTFYKNAKINYCNGYMNISIKNIGLIESRVFTSRKVTDIKNIVKMTVNNYNDFLRIKSN